ncbi:phage tail assembly protein [Sphingomonas canadensis]|uniref:Phage tail assembly protein n=1 Tax=Sphingomonas canadensis TaxID=1219257 RepID=A0ABW3H7Y9_9SPHN|nr:phage tail assembly protein [Sphingomonas canadensis]MCW3835968.1 phage tail assembly protein [Sphingomonas canadensis]
MAAIERPARLDANLRHALEHPVAYMLGDEARTLTHVQLRRPTGEELRIREGAGGYWNKLIRIAEAMSGEAAVLVDRIDGADVMLIGESLDWLFSGASLGVDTAPAPGERPAWLEPDNGYAMVSALPATAPDETAISRLQLRRLTAADMRAWDGFGDRVGRICTLVERMTGVPAGRLIKADAVDLDRIDDILGFFMEPGTATGAN